MRILWLSAIFSICFLGLALAAQVTTDRLDYPPGDTVWITGSGFSGGESVTVQVTHVDTLVTGGVGHNPWTVKANGGAFTTYWVVPYDDNGGESLKVTATGKISGRVAFAYFMDVNTILTFVTIPETINVGDTFCITANLKENCGGNPDAPLKNRIVLFFLTEANCGVDVGQVSPDSDFTDALGNATGCLFIPDSLPPGNYGVRIKFRGEDKPNPCIDPNSACDTTKCVELSNSNECKGIVAVANVCPQLTLTAPSSALVCQGGSVCIYLSATDANSADVITLSKLTGVSVYAGKSGSSPLNDTFCFVPSSSGPYTFIFRASDGTCFDDDTITISVTINSPPSVTGPADKNVFLCTCNEAKLIVIKPFTFSDVNNNIQSKTTNKGTLSGDSVYYTNTSCNPDTIIVTVTDSCGEMDKDTVIVTKTLNSAPVVTGPPDKNVFLCTCNEAKLIVLKPFVFSDPNSNIQSRTTNKGTLSGDSVYYTSTSCNPDTIIVTVTDSCSAVDKDTVIVTKTLNSAPVVTGPADKNVFLCACNEAKLIVVKSFTFSDVNNNIQFRTTNKGTLSGDSVYYFNSSCDPDTIIVCVTDSCGATDCDTVIITKSLDVAPVVTAPDSTKKLCAPSSITFQVCATDGDAGDTLTLEKCNGNGSFPTKKGLSPVCQSFTFTPDTCGTYVFCFKVTDQCGKVDYDTAVWKVEIDAVGPVVSAPDSNKTICKAETLSFQVCATDSDCGDTLTLEKTAGGGTFVTKVGPSPVCQTLKFYADTSGTYRFIFKATDECGKADFDTAVWVIKVNNEPVIICPSNGYVTVCTLGTPVCRQIMAYDLNGDSLCLNKICGSGSFSQTCGDSQVVANFCFVPDSSGVYQFCFEAKEKNGCGKADTCMYAITVKLDSFPPVANAPDSTKRICQADTIKFMVCGTDGDFGDSVTLEKCSGYGSFTTKKGAAPVCQEFKFFADTCGTYKFCFKATDQCGKVDYDTAVYKVEVNKSAPVVTAPDGSKSFCGPDTLKFQVCAADPDCSDSIKLEKVSGTGSFPTKTALPPVCETLRAYVDTSGTYKFVFKATDECGKTDLDTAVWVVTINQKPVITAPDTVSFVLCEEGNKVCFNVSANGGDGDSVCVEKTSGPGNFAKVCGKPQALGRFCWTPSFSDTNKCYSVVFKATDSCGVMALDTVTVCILPPDTLTCGPCIIAAIGEDTASPGSKVRIPIVIKANDTDIGGFSLCLEYDPALLTFINLERGQFFDQPGPIAGSYQWNYLVWRNNPSTVIHKFKLCIIGIGKLYYYGGICMPAGGQGVLYVEFRLSNNELYRCYRTPVIWERLDPQCIVNAFSDCSGNNVFVFDDTLFYNPRICDSTALWPKQDINICAGWKDGGVVFKCDVDPIVIGDINANGFAYEIGDAVLFANYFISGPSVFSSDPETRERQIASSDINRDGLTLSVADLVYLLRILAGDAQPLGGSKIAPMDQKAKVSVDNNTHLVEIRSPFDLGAVLLTFQGEAGKLEPLISGLEVKWGKLEGQTRVLIYGMNKGEKIPAGISKLVRIYGEVELIKVEAAEYYGMPVEVDVIITSSKPENYLLSQNYPNPFNANTTIKFATPIDGKVSLKIYNVAGQLVKEYSEFMNAGYHSFTWDGTGSNGEKVSSGVYLYKLQVGEFTEVRKMTLLK